MAEEYDEEIELRPQVIHVNLDPCLLLLLREIHYFSQDPFNLKLPGPARRLLRNTESHELGVTATRLNTIVAKYNSVMQTITEYELPLFERSLAKIDLVCGGLYSMYKCEIFSQIYWQIFQGQILIFSSFHRNNCGSLS